MAVNLATKYSDQLSKIYTRKSLLTEISMSTKNAEFIGARTVKVTTPITVRLNDYTREGTGRYGDVSEVQNIVQEFRMTQDKSYATTIDKGNQTDSDAILRTAAEWTKMELEEQVTPTIDKYALKRWAMFAGQIGTTDTAPTKDTILEMISDGDVALSDCLVPAENRTLIIPWSYYAQCRLSDAIVGVDKLGEQALAKGAVGTLLGMQVVPVPKSYMPSGCYFMILHRDAAFVVEKIMDAKVTIDPPGISGHLFEGRVYFDAFVRGAKANGVYVLVDASARLSPLAVSTSGSQLTVTPPSGADEVLYTVDGTDPRYSDTAKIYTGPLTVSSDTIFMAVAFASNSFTSPLVIRG